MFALSIFGFPVNLRVILGTMCVRCAILFIDFVLICDAFRGRFQVTRLGRPGKSQGDLISGQLDKKDPLPLFEVCRPPVTRDHLRPPHRSPGPFDRSLTSHLDPLTSHLGRLDVLLGHSRRPLGFK